MSQSFISNGSYLYMVEHDNKQVVKKNLANDLMPVAVSFLYGKGDLKAEFNASVDTGGKYGTKEDVVLKLVPKKPSAQYKALFLVVSTKDFHVSQSIIIDSSNNVNHFRFFTPDFAKPITPILRGLMCHSAARERTRLSVRCASCKAARIAFASFRSATIA